MSIVILEWKIGYTMINIYSKNSENKNIFNWQLSKYCEKRCHYCTSYDFRKSLSKKVLNDYSDDELKLDDHIFKLLNEQESSIIMLYGGEPTLHPKGIEYFNNLRVDHLKILVTHGDISQEKIGSIAPKGNHLISISYHMLQVQFDKWIININNFKRFNCIISCIIPRDVKLHDEFEKNVLILLSKNFNVELKLELDRNLETCSISYNRFKNLMLHCESNNYFYIADRDIIIEDANANVQKTIHASDVMHGIPILKNTICTNKQYGISSNKFSASCGEGNIIEIDTSIKQLPINECRIIKCSRDSCTESRHDINNIKMFGTLDELKIAKFLKDCVR